MGYKTPDALAQRNRLYQLMATLLNMEQNQVLKILRTFRTKYRCELHRVLQGDQSSWCYFEMMDSVLRPVVLPKLRIKNSIESQNKTIDESTFSGQDQPLDLSLDKSDDGKSSASDSTKSGTASMMSYDMSPDKLSPTSSQTLSVSSQQNSSLSHFLQYLMLHLASMSPSESHNVQMSILALLPNP